MYVCAHPPAAQLQPHTTKHAHTRVPTRDPRIKAATDGMSLLSRETRCRWLVRILLLAIPEWSSGEVLDFQSSARPPLMFQNLPKPDI